MRLNIFILFIILIFAGCSFKTPPNQWEYNSTSAYNSYEKYFLSNQDILAKSYINTAITNAKQSANLNQLARVYISACALNMSIEQTNYCKEYESIRDLVLSKELDIYFQMLDQKLNKTQIEYLPKQYQSFYRNFLLKKYDLAFKDLTSMEQITSKFIAASLIREQLTNVQVNYLIDIASTYGYKKLVIYWLKKQFEKELDTDKKQLISKKIEILLN
jgi:hypothetical protein